MLPPEQKAKHAAYMRAYTAANSERLNAAARERRAKLSPEARAAKLERKREGERVRVAALRASGWKRKLTAAQKVAAALRSKKFQESNGASISKRAMEHHVTTKYGLTLPEYYDLVSAPCEICGAAPGVDASRSRIECDHDHVTGAVRGALCGSCNRTLGAARDSVSRLMAAAAYLERHSNPRPTPKYI